MIRRTGVLFAAFLAVGAFAQQAATTSRYGSPTGFGSVLYPGLGHAPQSRVPGNITDPSFASRLGASVRGYPPYTGAARGVPHPSHSRQVIVPVPIIVGGGYYPYTYDPQQAAYGYDQQQAPPVQQQATPPVVIINQSYRPETAHPAMYDYSDSAPMRRYDAPVHPMPDPNDAPVEQRPAKRTGDDKATIYLIAFKDHTILPALAYWMEGDTLNYITQQGTPNRISLTLVDREFSLQLNRERQVEFNLPQ
jgi:hypothetical protein